MTLTLVVCLIIAHFTGDWLLQTRYMAINKSKDIKVLLLHLLIVNSAILLFCFPPYWWTLLVNALIHGLIDWNIWKAYKHKYFNVDHLSNKAFYDTIAVDQSLHLITLFALYSM